MLIRLHASSLIAEGAELAQSLHHNVRGATMKRTRVPLFSAFFMIYIFVSGGSFGI